MESGQPALKYITETVPNKLDEIKREVSVKHLRGSKVEKPGYRYRGFVLASLPKHSRVRRRRELLLTLARSGATKT